jgi:hypothetical protein
MTDFSNLPSGTKVTIEATVRRLEREHETPSWLRMTAAGYDFAIPTRVAPGCVKVISIPETPEQIEQALRSKLALVTAERDAARDQIRQFRKKEPVAFNKVTDREAVDHLRQYRKVHDHVYKAFTASVDILKGAPQKKTVDGVANWLDHTGGPRPVDGQKKVSVILRNGAELMGLAERYDWSHSKLFNVADIILWREVD